MKSLHFLISLLLPSFFLLSFSVSLVLSFSLSLTHLQNQCLDDQRSALLQLHHDLYYAPNFTFSSKANLWDPNSDCCSWKEITCDAFGHVIGLDLSYKNLSGSFHSIFNLHHLQRLNLAGNNFNTTLFHCKFDRLPNLTHLNLSNSCLHGQIPMEISYLTRLVSLDLSNKDSFYWRYQQILNQYYYSLPFDFDQPLKLENPNFRTLIKNLRSLTELHLDSVNISTQRSRWCENISTILPNLRVLSLSYCGLKGPLCSSLSRLPFLSKLVFDGNPLSYLPSNFFENSSHLVSLSLVNCNLSGHFPTKILSLPKMQSIYISENYYLGGWLPEFPLNSSLRILNLHYCNFYGQIPSSIVNLTNLVELDLSSNNFSGLIPPFDISGVPNLAHLILRENNLSEQIPSSIANLTNLVELDLSYNNFNGWIPPFDISGVPNLAHLILRENNLSEQIPSSIANLTNLVELDLSYNNFNGWIPPFDISGVPNLAHLILRENNLSEQIPSSIANLTNLVELDLFYNNFNGLIPPFDISGVPNLAHLILSGNNLSEQIPSSIANLTNLVELDLSYNNFSGLIPPIHRSGVPNLASLLLYGNQFSGPIHSSLFTLPSLQTLGLSGNKLVGEIGEFHNASSSLLKYLYLSNNYLSGSISKSFFQLSRLESLFIGYNNFDFLKLDTFFHLKGLRSLYLSNLSLLIGSDNISLTFPQLEELTLSSCNLTEFPKFIKRQDKLTFLDLSNNQIHGFVPNWLWKTALSSLDLSFNAIDFPKEFSLGDANSSFPMLRELYLLSCNLSTFPAFLKSQEKLLYLYLSNNKISGAVPNWVWKKNLVEIDLSGNSLSSLDQFSQNQSLTSSQGFLSSPICNLSQLWRFNASHNKLNGSIPSCFGNVISLEYLDLQENNFSGSIPDFVKASQLETLQLNDNQLEGKLPRSLANCTTLQILNLGNNTLHDTFPLWLGKLPELKVLILQANWFHGPIKVIKDNFPVLDVLDIAFNNFSGQLPAEFFETPQLRSLKMSGNKLRGKLPRSLANCRELEVLDLGKNMIEDNFPTWLVKLPSLKVLVLRANRFYGAIKFSENENAFRMLHILDLASNNFSGELSIGFFQSMKGMSMMTEENKAKPDYIGDGYYQDSVSIVNKGFEIFYKKILTIFACLDLSNNSFHGIIPKEIQSLKSLKVLNLSYNSFLGPIPSALGNLTDLESLDLSQNKLSGKIPLQLSSLTFLEVLNLSYNQLEGSIPQSYQFGTFSNDSYIGNPGLCGPPLTRKCYEADAPMALPGKDADSWVDGISVWKIALMGYASGLVIGLSIGFTVLNEMGNKWLDSYKRSKKRNGRRSR
ncbi:hypothetical protein PTKIN_Ptkin09bG0236300 [Pterospermum kingtungense]